MEVNKEEALRCLAIAQRHRNSSNLPSALRFARKSVSLYSTPEGEAMVIVIEREIESGGSSSTSAPSTPTGESGATKASGVEEHVSSAHARPGHSAKPAEANGTAGGAAAGSSSKKREYTVKQMEVVTRVKRCKHHEYYEILAVERTCTENDVKKAYKKLALALHPDKNGAPGADEAFKMVSKAFQVLSDVDMRASFDANPSSDPTQRGGGGGMSRGGGFPAGFANGGFQGEINPEDLFNMFFGGGMGGGGFGGGQANVFTFGGPGGFQAHYGRPRRRAAPAADTEHHPMVALIPILLLVFFAVVSILPGLLGENDPNPAYAFEPTSEYHLGRSTFLRDVPYWVNQNEWEKSTIWESVPEGRRQDQNAAMYSSKVKVFEKGVENVYINKLHNECDYFNSRRQQEIAQEAGIFGIGADYQRIAELRSQKSPSCEQLRDWGLLQQQNRPRGLF